MSEMVYYYLQKGDYLQAGDEYEDADSKSHRWKPIHKDWIGMRWGYDPKTGEPHQWAAVRRLIPKNLKKSMYEMQGPDLWGEEFELTVEEIRQWKKKNNK